MAITQSCLPFEPWMEPRADVLPGLQPITCADWLCVDDAFAAQMAYRDHLLETIRGDVLMTSDASAESACELLRILIEELSAADGYRRDGDQFLRSDGKQVSLNMTAPLETSARLVQEDLAILEFDGARHRFVAGAVCFPASWLLKEKIGRTLASLHRPVDRYTDQIDGRIERVFANLRPETPLMRANFLVYTDPDLHQPLPEGVAKRFDVSAPRYIRVERQTLRRLPQTKAIVFAIHTFQTPASTLSATSYARLAALRPELLADAPVA
ncbi:MAG: DUF3445 domain-containing protein [Pseudomonadota bacterium]